MMMMVVVVTMPLVVARPVGSRSADRPSAGRHVRCRWPAPARPGSPRGTRRRSGCTDASDRRRCSHGTSRTSPPATLRRAPSDRRSRRARRTRRCRGSSADAPIGRRAGPAGSAHRSVDAGDGGTARNRQRNRRSAAAPVAAEQARRAAGRPAVGRWTAATGATRDRRLIHDVSGQRCLGAA